MTKLKYTFHSDAGHGWLAVKRKELIDLDIMDKISGYSYISKTEKTIYLEEDGDLSTFFFAKVKLGAPESMQDWDVTESFKDYSPIRSLDSVYKLQKVA